MNSTGYNFDHRDCQFVLFEQLEVQQHFAGTDRFGDFDRDMLQSMIEEAARLAEEVLWPANRTADLVGCQLGEGGQVTTPPGFKEAWREVAEGGWVGIQGAPELGGIGAPTVLGVVVGELFSGANTSFTTYVTLAQAAADLLRVFGSDALKDLCLEKLYTGQWGATMCLTEADAGSDVGNNRATAHPAGEDGLYRLEGEKVFITAGDNDFTSNIVHLVLARTPGAPAGTAGLSLFAVPKFDFRDGSRNDVVVVGIEEKMGIHGSVTTTLALGAGGPCHGWLVGREHKGMRAMFHMMNEARIGVGIQGLSTAATSWLNALAYANERIQGSRIEHWRDPEAERVAIKEHPDVRRMLMIMKVATETMRSLLYTTALRADLATLARAAGDDAAGARHMNHVELMTPICKAHCTDLGFEVIRLAMQTFGGYGFIREYPVEQNMRDNKIASIYEGTNGIQAMDLLGRKLSRDNGALFLQWLGEAGQEVEAAKQTGALDDAVQAVQQGIQSLGAAAMHLGGLAGGGRLAEAMLYASPFLEAFGTVALGVHALAQARVAHAALQGEVGGSDRAFYRGKLLNASFYAHHLMPKAIALSKEIRSGDTSCLDPDLFGV